MTGSAPVVFKDCHFTVGDIELFARRWGHPGTTPILALHGWLDNSASFEVLAPLLAENCDVVCLDCAGHGGSGHRKHLGAYNIWQDVAEIFSVADQLGWQSFSLMGHSRGGMIAFLAAGTFPSRIDNLIMIDGICPRVAEPSEAPVVLAETIQMLKACVKRPKQHYESFDAAVSARVNGIFPIAENDARLLATQGLEKTARGFTWRYDHKLMAGSEVRLSREQVEAFKLRLPARKMLIQATDGLLIKDVQLQEWLSSLSDLEIQLLEGGHHLHMHEQGRSISEIILRYIGQSKSTQNN